MENRKERPALFCLIPTLTNMDMGGKIKLRPKQLVQGPAFGSGSVTVKGE